MSKIFTIAVGTAGYVLGARAGRQRYEQIKTRANKVWSNPRVQQAASDAQDLAAEKAPAVKDKAAAAAHRASSSAKDAAGKASSKVSRSKTSESETDEDIDVIAFPATTSGGATHG
ncbi:MAG: hypothetical protein ABW004_12475 [Aeromicrobium sp.]